MGPGYLRLQTWPGAERPQLGTSNSILPGQGGQRRVREHWLVVLDTPGPIPSLPKPPPFCLCWKWALKWRNLTCHLLATGSYLVPKVLNAWQSPAPKSWVHPSTLHLKTRLDGAWRWRWGSPREEGGSAYPERPQTYPLQLLGSWLRSLAQKASSLFNLRGAVCLVCCFSQSRVFFDCVQHMQTHAHTLTLTHTSGVQGHSSAEGRHTHSFTLPGRPSPFLAPWGRGERGYGEVGWKETVTL